MCCTGACLYEDYTGECTIGNGYFPDDAWCQLPPEENEFKEQEEIRKPKSFCLSDDPKDQKEWDEYRNKLIIKWFNEDYKKWKEHQNDETT